MPLVGVKTRNNTKMTIRIQNYKIIDQNKVERELVSQQRDTTVVYHYFGIKKIMSISRIQYKIWSLLT